jgi:hypothetical protein
VKKALEIFFLRADWKAILLCILAALTFWFFNAMNHDYTTNISCPVIIDYNKEKLIPVTDIPTKLNFNATGYGWNFLRNTLNFNENPIFVRPSDLPQKKFMTANELLPLISHQLPDFKINYMLDDTIYLNFDIKNQKICFITVNPNSIQLAPGQKIVSPISISPKFITYTGPFKILKSLPDTLVIDLPSEEINGAYDEEVTVNDQSESLIRASLNTVRISFDTRQAREESVILTPDKIDFPGGKYEIIPSTVKLQYFVKDEDQGKAKPDDFTAIVKYENGSILIPQLTKKPDYLLDYKFIPSSVSAKALKSNGK